MLSVIIDFINYLTKSKYHDDSNKLVIGKMKDETSVAIEELVGLKPKMYSFLVDNKEHENAKGLNKNVVATISHNEYQDVLLNNECIRHSTNRIESTDHRTRTYEINKISLSSFDNKIYIQNNGHNGLALGYRVSEKLMPIAQHPNRWWNFHVQQDEKKVIESIFTE